ncbi:MAG TPA: hypothetical protein VLJ15_03540 [Gammaproteobacteria bacterium]|nr:hypothetical protein [Gammaproteobacteria bacterium]
MKTDHQLTNYLIIEDVCKRVYKEITTLITRSNIINRRLAQPITSNELQICGNGKEAYYQRVLALNSEKNSLSIKAVKMGSLLVFSLLVGFSLLLVQDTEKRSSNSFIDFSLLGFILALFHKSHFQNFPLELTGNQLFFSKKMNEDCRLEDRYNQYMAQTRNSFQCYHPTNNSVLNESILRGIYGVKNNVHDCVSISAIVLMKLIQTGQYMKIEWLHQEGKNYDGHFYIVVNRQKGKLHQLNTWNDDAWIIDGWYDFCISAKKIKEDENFFQHYPVLTPERKIVLVDIDETNWQEWKDKLAKSCQRLEAVLKTGYYNPCPQVPYLNRVIPII